MKFNYEYRTSDNVKHTGVIAASDREAAYAALKQRGIRPGFLAEAPGFFNKLFGKGKRWLAIGVLSAVCGVLAVIIRSTPTPSTYTSFDAATRRQIIGDTAVIEKGIRTGWADVFTLEGDRFLASFAIPGAQPAVRTTTEEKLVEALRTLHSALCTDAEGIEARQIRAIVSGMKREINGLLEGGWTLREVGSALARRQDREIAIYRQVENEIGRAKATLGEDDLLALWERKNDELRNLGIRPVPMPE